ncbi:MAG: LPS-assembly lipoprotein LptE [Gammaproteobacteria bacterium]
MFTRILTYCVFAVLFTGCGYTLRGEVDLPQEMKTVYIEGGSNDIRDALTKNLRYSSGNIVTNPGTAGVTLKILGDKLDRRSSTLTSRGKSKEFELNFFLEYELLDSAGNSIAPITTIELVRYYFNDQRDIVARDIEEGVIRRELYDQAARRVIDQARFVFK